MALFNNNRNPQGNFVDTNSPQFLRQKYTAKYASARNSLLLVTVMTAINVLMTVLNTGYYFLFSAYVPLWLIDISMHFCGKMPAEYYEEYFSLYGEFEFVDSSLLTGAIVIAFVVALLYLVCFFFSNKNRVGWIIAGLVLFSVDSLLMILLGGLALSSVLDIVFHVWVIVSLAGGIIAYHKLKSIPEDVPVQFEDVSEQPSDANGVSPQNVEETTEENSEDAE